VVTHAAPVAILFDGPAHALSHVGIAFGRLVGVEMGLEAVHCREEDLEEPSVPTVFGIEPLPPLSGSGLLGPSLVRGLTRPVSQSRDVIEVFIVRDRCPLEKRMGVGRAS